MLTYFGWAAFVVVVVCLLGLLGGLPAHRDGWRAGLRQYGTTILLLLLGIGIFIYVTQF